MANDLSASLEGLFSNGIQKNLQSMLVGTQIAGQEAQDALNMGGDTYHKPYIARGVAQTYSRQTDVTMQDHTATDETLVVNTAKVYPFYIDHLDRKQLRKYKATLNHLIQEASFQLNREIDGDFFSEYANANKYFDAGDFSGTPGEAVTLATNNVANVFSTAHAYLVNTIGQKINYFLVIDPYQASIIQQAALSNAFALADTTFKNGYAGDFLGFKVYVSTNLNTEADLTIETNPTNGDTISINGVTFTFVSSLGSTAGNVLIGGNAAASVDNLVAAMNGAAGAGSTYVALTSANRNRMDGLTATDNDTSITIVSKRGRMVLSETLTDGTDGWGDQVVHALVGERGSIELAVQQQVQVDITQPALKLGKNYLPWVLYGKKTFTEGKDRFVDLRIKA